jgi:hypothetical protein
MAKLRRWGPWAWSTDQCGRSAGLPMAPTAPNSLWWAVLTLLVLFPGARSCLKWICLGNWAFFGPFEPELML